MLFADLIFVRNDELEKLRARTGVTFITDLYELMKRDHEDSDRYGSFANGFAIPDEFQPAVKDILDQDFPLPVLEGKLPHHFDHGWMMQYLMRNPSILQK